MENILFYFAKALRKILHPPAIRSSEIDKTSKICSGSQINYVKMGRYSYIGHNCFLNNVTIGSFCSIADDVHIGGATHPLSYVSTSPVFHSGTNIMKKNIASLPDLPGRITVIENDVWIGQGAYIKEGVTIATGAVVGFGSVVTKDIPAYAIVAANPAKLVRYRFEENTISKLLDSKWWEWSEDALSRAAKDFDKPDLIIKTE